MMAQQRNPLKLIQSPRSQDSRVLLHFTDMMLASPNSPTTIFL